MAFECAQAVSRLHVPQPHDIVTGTGEDALSIQTERNGTEERRVVELESFFCNLPTHGLCCRRWRLRWRPAGFEELRILLLTVLRKPVDVQELRQGAFDGGFVEPQGNEAALLVQRVAKAVRIALQLRPVGTERLRRHAEHEHAGVLQPIIDLLRNAVAGLELPLIEPHA
jgi:hypothetical protein